MSEPPPSAEYLVISRGEWDRSLSRDQIENVIDQFYRWLERLVDEGKMRRGQRLTYEGKTISQKNVKEVIGGFWFVIAGSLDEAAVIASCNPCLDCGLSVEVRPIDPERATPDNTVGRSS